MVPFQVVELVSGAINVSVDKRFAAFCASDFLYGGVLRDSDEVAVNHTVWFSVSTPAGEARIVQSSVQEHMPDSWISEVMGLPLGP